MTRGAARGTSLVELLIGLAVALLVIAGAVQALQSVGDAAVTIPDATDARQRVRAATDAVASAVQASGNGPLVGPCRGPLSCLAPPLLPVRLGGRSPDPVDRVVDAHLTAWGLIPGGAQAMLSAPLSPDGTVVAFAPNAWCAEGDATCGFQSGQTVALLAPDTSWEWADVVAVGAGALTVARRPPSVTTTYPVGTVVAAAMVSTFALKADPLGGQVLVGGDGGSGAERPMVDHLDALAFALWGEAAPPVVHPAPGGDPPWTVTYGPSPRVSWLADGTDPPPAAGMVATSPAVTPACLFTVGADGVPVSTLRPHGEGRGIVSFSAAEFTDGPWCPSATSPRRFDADLLRIRLAVATATAGPTHEALRPGTAWRGRHRVARVVPSVALRRVVAPAVLAR